MFWKDLFVNKTRFNYLFYGWTNSQAARIVLCSCLNTHFPQLYLRSLWKANLQFRKFLVYSHGKFPFFKNSWNFSSLLVTHYWKNQAASVLLGDEDSLILCVCVCVLQINNLMRGGHSACISPCVLQPFGILLTRSHDQTDMQIASPQTLAGFKNSCSFPWRRNDSILRQRVPGCEPTQEPTRAHRR